MLKVLLKAGPGGLALLLVIGLALVGSGLGAEDLEEEEVLEQAVAIVVSRVAASVVTIDTLGDLEEAFQAPRSAAGKKKGVLAKKGFKQAYGPSSGVVISPDGYILTSLFMLQRKPRHIFVTAADGRQFVAQVVGRDESRGLALLKVEVKRALPVAPVRAKSQIEAGAFCIAIGRGFGAARPNVSVGIISARDRIAGKAIQASALISPANYGGVLAGIDGRLLGIIVPLDASGGLAGVDLYDSGIGFAIPLSDVVAVLPRLIQGETLEPGFIGIQADQERTAGGIAIKSVVRRSPAEKAGLKAGDLITAVDGRNVKTYFEFFYAIGSKVAGETVTVKYLREGVLREIEVKLDKRPKQAPSGEGAPAAPEPDKDADPDHDHDHDHDEDHKDGDEDAPKKSDEGPGEEPR